MQVSIPYKYRQFWRPSEHHRKKFWYYVETIADIEVKALNDKEFPIAGRLLKRDLGKWKVKEEYRYYNGKLWAKDSGPQVKDEELDNQAQPKSNTGVVLDENTADIQLGLLQFDANNTIFFEGDCWRKCKEPVVFIRREHHYKNKKYSTFIDGCFLEKQINRNVINVSDIDWKRKDVLYHEKMEVLLPEAFKFGRDKNELGRRIKQHAWDIWRKIFQCGKDCDVHSQEIFGETALKTILPEVVERTLAANRLPYRFSDDDIVKAIGNTLDEVIERGLK